MSTSSRKKKAGQAKRAAWLTLLFVNIVAPIVLLVLDKSLPDGLFGRKGNSETKEVRLSLRQMSQLVFIHRELLVHPLKLPPQGLKIPSNEENAVSFSNKGDGNEIENLQELGEGTKSTGFSNEGNNNNIKNVQRSK